MDRRKSISLVGAGALFLVQNAFPAGVSQLRDTAEMEGIKEAFNIRWQGLRIHTFEVFNAMPATQFGFQPSEEVMSFAKLFSHVAASLDNFAGILDGTSHNKEVESVEKEVVFTYLQTQFERFEATYDQLDASDLYGPKHKVNTKDGEIYFSDYDILMLSYNHTVHHKGQATTYLRLKGIAPPQYRF